MSATQKGGRFGGWNLGVPRFQISPQISLVIARTLGITRYRVQNSNCVLFFPGWLQTGYVICLCCSQAVASCFPIGIPNRFSFNLPRPLCDLLCIIGVNQLFWTKGAYLALLITLRIVILRPWWLGHFSISHMYFSWTDTRNGLGGLLCQGSVKLSILTLCPNISNSIPQAYTLT